jgi:hypothetical protein
MWHRSLSLQLIRNFNPSEIIPLKRAPMVTVHNINGSRWLLLYPHFVQSVHVVITVCFIHKRTDALCPFSSLLNCNSMWSSTDRTLYFRDASHCVIIDSITRGHDLLLYFCFDLSFSSTMHCGCGIVLLSGSLNHWVACLNM